MAVISLQATLDHFKQSSSTHPLQHIQRGIEKESLRISQLGLLSQRPHPRSLGSALTHGLITTDYSEALLELITGVHHSPDDCLQELENIHRFVYQCLEDEILWVASMPCFIAEEKEIPIAQYGHSNIGRMKHIYRIGLEHRYSRLMQTIAGIHYNFSLDDAFWQHYQAYLNDQRTLQAFKNEQYFCLMRNFQRHAWLLVYLFGASPAICPTFVRNRPHQLQRLANGDLGYADGTCLRMGDLGYQSDAQKDILVTYNHLDNYIQRLLRAMFKQHPEYARIGLKKDQQYLQLNTNLLQIENEFYSIIRPKCVTQSGEAPLIALAERGVAYIEVRCLDLNPFLPLGIDAEQIHFLDSFLLFCLLSPSPELSAEEAIAARADFTAVVNHGLQAGLTLSQGDLRTQASKLLDEIESVCQLLDQAQTNTPFAAALAAQRKKVANATETPAGQILQQLMPADAEQQHFFHWALQRSLEAREHFNATPLDRERLEYFKTQASESLIAQARVEQSPQPPFDTFLAHYYAQYEALQKTAI